MKQSAFVALFVSIVVYALATRRRNGPLVKPQPAMTLSAASAPPVPLAAGLLKTPKEDSPGFVGQLLVGILRLLLLMIIYGSCLVLALTVAGLVVKYLSVEPTLKVVFDTAQQRTASAGSELATFESLVGPLTTDQQIALDTAKLTVASVQFSYLTFELALFALAAAIVFGVWTVVAPAISDLLDAIAPFPPSR